MKKYIVITGGAGFVGSNLIKLLIQKTQFNLISLDNYSTGSKVNHLISKRITYLKGNCIDINKKLKKYKKQINSIFHFGEFSRIYKSFNNFDQ